MAKAAEKDTKNKDKATNFLDMTQRYYNDALHYKQKNDYVLAYGALNYSHDWLDAGARAKFFKVNDNRLFTVDPK